MKRVEEKVKDIVEVRPFVSLYDFTADPALTLTGYQFTDITSDLMGKWLDAVASVSKGHGRAVALAGFRGVGKSHFLAALAAIASRPEIRSLITDQHVAARSERLTRIPNPVAFVRRGSQETLLEELRYALAEQIGLGPQELSDSFSDMLLKASEKAGEMSLVLLIDTALGRDSRVSRDDGVMLSEIAEAAKSLGIFVGLALDDDIAGADGANSSISGSFSIDYLDQEHLYKVVDSYIFAKKDQALPLLHEIYKHYSSVLPGFRWSEQRFTSLYPLHPATLEIAPLIRLYLQDFAMLGFASEAGMRILGRPANSLIGLDEIFDAVDKKMRNVSELLTAFAAFDKLDRDVVSKTPVHLRLPAKLILKGLFMLSLDGQGSTAANVAASMLIVNENETGPPSVDVPQLLESFAAASTDSITKHGGEGADPTYRFNLAIKEELDGSWEKAAAAVPPDAARTILLRHLSERFSELGNAGEFGSAPTHCTVEWRGAARHGEIWWDFGSARGSAPAPASGCDLIDWSIFVNYRDEEKLASDSESGEHPTVEWRLGKLRDDETETIRRLYALQTDLALREEFGERISAATQSQALAVDKICKRVLMSDAILTYGGAEFRFSEAAAAAHNLSHLFTLMLGPIFESAYPSHPEFPPTLGVKETAKLTGQFFGGGDPRDVDIQRLAQSYAMPLGLVELHDGELLPLAADALLEVPLIRSILDGVKNNAEAVITIEDLSSRMLAAPFGLARDARHLVLAALVAQRQFEFVTFTGNRINHRSLDLQIIWDDIAGIAQPFSEVYSGERLREWAVLITGLTGIKSLDRSDNRLAIIGAMTDWLTVWKAERVLEKFDALPDESLNSSIWRIAANLQKTFGAMADCIDALVQNITPLDQCIHNIADLFSDSELEFEKKKSDLYVLRDFTIGAAKRDEIITYLSLCETTADNEVEQLRQRLLELTGAGYFAATAPSRVELDGLWDAFKGKFSSHYVEKHNSVMNSAVASEKLDEVLKSDRWTAFESFSDLDWFNPEFGLEATTVIRSVRQTNCKAPVADLLLTRPFCRCRFSLAHFERRQDHSKRLEMIVDQALSNFRLRLIENTKEIAETITAVSKDKNSQAAGSLKKWLSDSKDPDGFSNLTSPEIRLLRTAIERASKRQMDANPSRSKNFRGFSEPTKNEFHDW